MNKHQVACLEKICHIYGNGKHKIQVLNNISLTISQGEFLAISGPSGSGKSTLLHILGCLMQPTSGSYFLLGQETSRLNKYALARVRNATFGFVFQNFNLLPRASALQNVVLPLIYGGVKRRDRLDRGREVLKRVGLADRISHRPNELSGGEQQRVAIARALANRPKILLADEPTGNLDNTTSKHIVGIFQDLVNEGLTVVLVSHDRNVVDRATRKITLTDNRLMEEKLIIA